jgi:hypothetical protein
LILKRKTATEQLVRTSNKTVPSEGRPGMLP